MKRNLSKHSWFLFILILTNILHNILLFASPVFFIDEFYYSSRAWSFASFGSIEIVPYYFSYDHPPLGWMILGILGSLLPGLSWISRARIIISLFFLIEEILIYCICIRFFDRKTGNISVGIFGLQSGLMKFERMVFLDNIAIVFLLLALYLFIKEEKATFKSGFIMGCAIMVKFSLIPFIFAFIVLYFHFESKNKNTNEESSTAESTNQTGKKFKFHLKNIIVWLIFVSIPLLIFILYALIDGSFISDDRNSFLITTYLQMIRGDNFLPWDSSSQFYESFQYWMNAAPFFWIFSFLVTISYIIIWLHIVVSKKSHRISFRSKYVLQFSKKKYIIAVFYMVFFLFLIRGGVTYNFYFIPLFPFGSIILGVAINDFKNIHKNYIKNKADEIHVSKTSYISLKKKGVTFLILGISLGFVFFPFEYQPLYSDQNNYQHEVLDWIVDNLPKDAFIVSGAYFLPELREEGFTNVHLVWRCFQSDLYMNETYFNGTSKIIDYLILTPYLQELITIDDYYTEDGIITNAYCNSNEIQKWVSPLNSNEWIQIYKCNK
jgi:Dolichyl-phosphate-mannose-protein mannosyltransferase